jgi:hypothetical protein
MSQCVSTFYVDFKAMHDRMVRSLLHFHPEVNLEVTAPQEVERLGLMRLGWGYPLIELPLFERYSTVTHIDADVIVVDRLDELFEESGDVRAGRNNSDHNRCCNHRGVSLPRVSWKSYVNAGIHSVSSPAFMERWLEITQRHVRRYRYGENDTLNVLFHSGRYNARLLDPIDSKICYGTSLCEGTQTFWDLWKQIIIVDDHLEHNGRRIRLLHLAGGLPVRPPIEDLVSKEVAEFIREIVK